VLDSGGSCLIQAPGGRVGHSGYSLSEDGSTAFIYFNGFFYGIINQEGGRIMLDQNGNSSDEEEEALDGFVFSRDDSAEVNEYDLSDLVGVWKDDKGTTLSIDIDALEYSYQARLSSGTGTIGNDEDGLGWFIYSEGKAYAVLAEDGSLSFLGEDPIFAESTFTREE